MLTRFISSLEKCFLDEQIKTKKEVKRLSMLKNERLSFQFCYQVDCRKPVHNYRAARLEVVSPLKDRLKLRRVENVPVEMPFYNPLHVDEDALRAEPGLFPDPLTPFEGDRLLVFPSLHALWIDVEGTEELAAGSYPVTFRLLPMENMNPTLREDKEAVEATVEIEVIDACLPEQTSKVSQWFYCDCLQKVYGTEAFDERHWQIIEEFMKAAVKNGINMILTPLLTPPLDTYVGGERPTTQLVKIKKEKEKYSFDFSRLERWVALCDRLGVKYFEVNHMFTQWGSKHCPKVVAEVNGREERIFGWDTEAAGEEYKSFLSQLIGAFLEKMKSLNGADKRCYFHVSDEPSSKHLESYKAAREVLCPLVKGYPVIDALSHVEYYDQGLVEIPVPLNEKVEDFMDREISERWVYYCCNLKAPNRFLGLPSRRNRVLGALMYKFGIKGFLHWGYNFYFNENSFRVLDPWICTDGEGFGPAGDAFSVYPGRDGSCVESLRLKVAYDAFQDQRALELCESLYGRDFVLGLLAEAEGGAKWNFVSFPADSEALLRLRERVNAAIKAKL